MKKKKNTEKTATDYILLGVFIALLILVIILLIITIKNRPKTDNANFTIPIIEKKLSTNMNIDLYKLKDQNKGYILDIESYYNQKTIKEEITYDLKFINNSSGKITINKNTSNKNIAKTSKEFTISNTFGPNKKQKDTYTIKVSGNVKEGDTLDIAISSR